MQDRLVKTKFGAYTIHRNYVWLSLGIAILVWFSLGGESDAAGQRAFTAALVTLAIMIPVSLICIFVLTPKKFKYIRVSAKERIIENNFTKINLSDLESFSGEDETTRSVDKHGNVKTDRSYYLFLYGPFGQKNIVFANDSDRHEAINAIEKTLEYLSSTGEGEENSAQKSKED